jgi:hypothetical protein
MDILADHDHPIAAAHDSLSARQLDQHRGHLPLSQRRQQVVPCHVRGALGHAEAHLSVARDDIALLDVFPAAGHPQRHAEVRVGLHLAELVMPRRRVTVVQDDSIDARPALLDAEENAGILCTQALKLAPHVVTAAHQRCSLLHDRCVRTRVQRAMMVRL